MSKTIRNCFSKNLTFEKLVEAHYRASKLKSNKKEILKFNIDLETHISSILLSLKNGTYSLGKYQVFKIYEPKEREIKCLPYKDRIVQQWYVHEFIKPYIVPRFIYTNCACIDNRGTHFAVNMVQKYMRIMKREYQSYYIIKMDIKKYFYNIDRNILFKIMKEYISDKKLLDLTYKFIFDNEDEKGIPIGNYTSQYFANIYLDKLDKYVKEVLKVRFFCRFMDDCVLLVKDKEEARWLYQKIALFLLNELKLELNHKSRIYPSKFGINFCGYRIFETHRLLRVCSKQKIKRKVKRWQLLSISNKLDRQRMLLCLNSWLGHAKHANSYNLQNKIIDKVNKIMIFFFVINLKTII